jgi:hypothetical protein
MQGPRLWRLKEPYNSSATQDRKESPLFGWFVVWVYFQHNWIRGLDQECCLVSKESGVALKANRLYINQHGGCLHEQEIKTVF